ncbi:phenylalanine--tRNA ligase subunit beta [Candidatus Marsarchaeota archaeon]|nr:phenylalanine--tRNA ligase subunit beta [Candidatus Marsarchaeota archaeon]
MATATFKISAFEQHGISKEALNEFLPRIGIEVERIEGDQIAVDVTPNRPDLLDQVGMLRALLFFSRKRVPKENAYMTKGQSGISITTTRAVRKVRPFIGCIVVKGTDLKDGRLESLINFAEKLSTTYGRKRKKLAMGMHDLSKIEGNLIYDAAKDRSFVPLGAGKEMKFEKILEEHKKGVEYSNTVKRAGNQNYPFLEDSKKVLSMIPIINSEATKVTAGTKDLLIDVTGTSKNAVNEVLRMLACSFIDSGADVYSCTTIYGNKSEESPDLKNDEIKINGALVRKTLGAQIGESEMIGLANMMGYVAAKYGNSIIMYPPPYRIDILNEQDIVEDFAIAYGYDRIKPLPVPSIAPAKPDADAEDSDATALFMVGLGFSEAINTLLTSEKSNFDNMRRKYDKTSVISIAESKSEAITMLRSAILPQLLESLANSSSESMPQRMFEIGQTFRLEGSRPTEEKRLAFVIEHPRANFSEAKGAVSAMLDYLGLKFTIEGGKDPAFIDGRCAKIVVNGKSIGVFGEIHPEVLENFSIAEPVVAAEMHLIEGQ